MSISSSTSIPKLILEYFELPKNQSQAQAFKREVFNGLPSSIHNPPSDLGGSNHSRKLKKPQPSQINSTIQKTQQVVKKAEKTKPAKASSTPRLKSHIAKQEPKKLEGVPPYLREQNEKMNSKVAEQAKILLKNLENEDRLERSIRIFAEADKPQLFSIQQKQCLQTILSSPDLYSETDVSNINAFAKRLHQLWLEELAQKAPDANEGVTLSKCEKLVEAVKPYQVKTLNVSPIDQEQVMKIEAGKYDDEEKMSKFIKEHDSSQKHTMNVDKYLNVRFSRTIVKTMKAFQEDGRNVEIFIGPQKDMIAYYGAKGCLPVAQLESNNSDKFYTFASEDASQNKLVISGISTQTRLNSALLKLKFLKVDLDKIPLRGSLQSAMEEDIVELQKKLLSFRTDGLEPYLAFIGTTWLPFKELCSYIGARTINPLQTVKDQQHKVYQALRKYGYKIDFASRFASAQVNINGKVRTIIAFQMPYGNLAGLVTELILKSGFKHLCMAGAGGSIDKDRGGDVGALQIIEKSVYQGDELTLPKKYIMPFDKMKWEGITVKTGCSNITVDSPLEEDTAWLDKAQAKRYTSVDVETFHIFAAILKEDREDVSIFPGIFNSDVLGEHPLGDKISTDNAYRHFPGMAKAVFQYENVSQIK